MKSFIVQHIFTKEIKTVYELDGFNEYNLMFSDWQIIWMYDDENETQEQYSERLCAVEYAMSNYWELRGYEEKSWFKRLIDFIF